MLKKKKKQKHWLSGLFVFYKAVKHFLCNFKYIQVKFNRLFCCIDCMNDPKFKSLRLQFDRDSRLSAATKHPVLSAFRVTKSKGWNTWMWLFTPRLRKHLAAKTVNDRDKTDCWWVAFSPLLIIKQNFISNNQELKACRQETDRDGYSFQ